MFLYCVRHGETIFNSEGRIQGQLDTPLSPLGLRQCQAVTAALAVRPIKAIYSSPLQRAFGTAQRLAEMLGLPVQVDERLMEIHAGIFQGHTWPEIDSAHPEESRKWRSHDPDFRIPGGESRRDIMHRAKEAFFAMREAAHEHAAVVAHGGLLSAAFKALLEIPAQRNPFSLNNGSISVLAWSGELKLLRLNDTEHLQGAQGTGGDL